MFLMSCLLCYVMPCCAMLCNNYVLLNYRKARDHNPLGRKSSLTKYCPTYKTFEAVLYCLKDVSVLNITLL